jgi:hypothetical protein
MHMPNVRAQSKWSELGPVVHPPQQMYTNRSIAVNSASTALREIPIVKSVEVDVSPRRPLAQPRRRPDLPAWGATRPHEPRSPDP